MHKRIPVAAVFALTLFGSFTTWAGPVTTVPWNGYVGAVSFTFDDALKNQIDNLKPILEGLPDVKVTFFVTNMSNGLQGNAAGFAALANAGHEIGNHTLSHGHMTGQSESELNGEIVDFAGTIEKTLESAGAKVKVVSFAAPFCETNESVQKIIAKRHFNNRNCGWHGRNMWETEPEMFNIQAKIWTRSGATATEMLSAMDTAAFIGDFSGANPWDVQVTGGSWLVVLNHGVTDDTGDDYSINPSDIEKIMKRAVEDKLWTASFGTVAAYHRAHFVIDAAEAVASDDGFTVSWKIPDEHMPEKVPLRVKIDKESVGDDAVVEQDGKVVAPESDGTFIVDFMAASLKVRRARAGEVDDGKPDSTAAPDSTSAADSSTVGDSTGTVGIVRTPSVPGVSSANYAVFDLNGNCLGTSNGFVVPDRMPRGVYIVRASAPGLAPVAKVVRK
ncbi:MAG: polysaccharide deacetylase family protein [Fibrobacter sp.]|nr:polysaccharide deacetylase family protein [Fibrobacter sp.]